MNLYSSGNPAEANVVKSKPADMKSSTHLLTLIASLTAFSPIQTNFSAVIDGKFAAQINGTVHALSVDRSGRIVVGGEFSEINGTTRHNIGRVESSGAIDSNFTVSADGAVLAIARDAQGSTYIAGAFNSPERHLARIDSNGQLSPLSIGSSTSSRVDCLAIAADGSAVVGGPFRRFDGVPSVYVGKVNGAGAIDSTFSSSLAATLSIEAGADAIAVQPDGKVLVGGNLSTAGGVAYLVRLNADGSIDSTFNGDHGPLLYTKAINVLENGQILVAGVANSSGEGFVRRLNADGSVDVSFPESNFKGSVEAIAIDSEGGVLVGGSFSGGLAHLHADGTSDSTWNISTDGPVKALAVGSDNTVVVGGAFTTIGQHAQLSIARIILGPKQQSVATNANGRFHGRIQGEAGKTYEIEASSDLKTWASLGSAVATEDGIAISDSLQSGRKHRFFRARLIQ